MDTPLNPDGSNSAMANSLAVEPLADYPALNSLQNGTRLIVIELVDLFLNGDALAPSEQLGKKFVDLALWALNDTMTPTPYISETLRSFGVTEDAKSWLQWVKGIRNHSSKEKREELYNEGIQAFEARQEYRKSGNELIARIEGSPAPWET
ncbi:hypothetical protein LZ32DRAFT_623740 [Colletotrichum eremochloae]|nr:hypothetical protein LZ32DRAFT_623740 [Colletotrichum eremochloae]